ncbi:sigma-E factor negative regulatory protein [Pseudomonas sp. UBA6310]|uniref:sigma-E factor negative regulatory protein n=1 Tax=Pseudomonas sp. UBA6310 TaxID=1947327 RepID=UPI002579EFCB|nr:RseA family anti-sigma factor [Pseudomonas sp. UBA6310]
MTRESLQESLSAVMDNEADQLELRRVIAASDDADVRATWSRYQVARAVMHKELFVPHLDIASAVSAAIAEEKVPGKVSTAWRSVGRLAVAASVTVAVLAGVRFYNQDEVGGVQLAQQAQPSQVTVPQQVAGGAVLAGFTANGAQAETPVSADGNQAAWHDQRLAEYLRQHAQQSASNGVEGPLPYARAASLEEQH